MSRPLVSLRRLARYRRQLDALVESGGVSVEAAAPVYERIDALLEQAASMALSGRPS